MIDLVWSADEPRFLRVARAVLAELVVQSAAIATEATNCDFLGGLADALEEVDLTRISHEELKKRCTAAYTIVRTGETTPYPNLLLTAGVPF